MTTLRPLSFHQRYGGREGGRWREEVEGMGGRDKEGEKENISVTERGYPACHLRGLPTAIICSQNP
jgi:hypothetical protein